MDVIVNGQSVTCADACTMAQLLEQLQIPTAGTAAARNDRVVRKALYAETPLAPGDRIEIIRAVGGG
ncbi:MAG: sulfur carrier protein ThiS [Armatimonadota bacterium]